jgi:hypothetical protein
VLPRITAFRPKFIHIHPNDRFRALCCQRSGYTIQLQCNNERYPSRKSGNHCTYELFGAEAPRGVPTSQSRRFRPCGEDRRHGRGLDVIVHITEIYQRPVFSSDSSTCLPEESCSCSALTPNFSTIKRPPDGTWPERVTYIRYLPEAAHPYYVLRQNGFEVVFASPDGIASILNDSHVSRRRSPSRS